MALAAIVLTAASSAVAEPRPALDDFYQRTRSRADGFDQCLGYCDGEKLAAFLIGAQAANPSTDAVQQSLAYGGRLGIDLGATSERYNIVRTKLWADMLRVEETDESITDLAWDTTLFHVWGNPGDVGAHLSLNTLLAQRSELEPSDFADFQLTPYRLWDVELEATPVFDKIDKDTFWAFPLGTQIRTRWDKSGSRVEERRRVSAAIAARGFLKSNKNHYQLDFLRATRSEWQIAKGEATGTTLSAGYQRLSPDVEWLQIWLLGGYGWYRGDNKKKGVIAQLGAEMTFPGETHDIEFGPLYEAHFVLDKRDNRFARVHDARVYYRHRIGVLLLGLSYQAVAIEDVATLHAVTPQAGMRFFGVELVGRYRFTSVNDDRFAGAPATNRFNLSADWIF